MEKRVINIDAGEEKDKAYMYETRDLEEKNRAMSKPEMCAEEIISHVTTEKMSVFSKKDLESIDYDQSTIKRALKILENEGSIISSGTTRNRSFVVNVKQ